MRLPGNQQVMLSGQREVLLQTLQLSPDLFDSVHHAELRARDCIERMGTELCAEITVMAEKVPSVDDSNDLRVAADLLEEATDGGASHVATLLKQLARKPNSMGYPYCMQTVTQTAHPGNKNGSGGATGRADHSEPHRLDMRQVHARAGR